MSDLVYDYWDAPVGKLLLIASPKGLRRLVWEQEYSLWTKHEWAKHAGKSGRSAHIRLAQKELDQYFCGKLEQFTVALDPLGTSFQMQAWAELCKIPFGKTISYSEQARRLGDHKKARAVGGANGRNPISIIVPCHRVVGKNGDLTGFAFGLKAKQALLRHERSLI